jgi:hypothetical protein
VRSEIGIAIRKDGGQLVTAKLDTIDIPAGRNEKDTYTNLYRYLVPPDTYTVAMHVRPLEGNSFGTWKARKLIPKPTPDLALSDIQYLLPSNLKTSLEIDGVKVVPSPFNGYPNDRPLYLYFHVYGLVRDFNGAASYTVRYLLTPAGENAPEIDPDNPPPKTFILAEKARDGTEDTSAEFASLDLGRVDAGSYILTVAVKDRMRVTTVRASRRLELFEP